MYWDVKTVKPLPDYRIYVEIEDGREGIFDLKPYLDHGVFRELRDVNRLHTDPANSAGPVSRTLAKKVLDQ